MIIDLTYPIKKEMFKYPSDPEISVEMIQNKGNCQNAYRSISHEITMRNHHGTHIDAPCHKIPGGKKISDYKLSKFINTCCIIDLSSTGLMKREKREITKDDFEKSIKKLDKDYGNLGAIIIYTGFCDEIENVVQNEGMPKILEKDKKEKFESKFPYLSANAAEYIINSIPNLNIVGIDSFAIGNGKGSDGDAHHVFFSKDILPLETLVNLGELKNNVGNNGFLLISAPLLYHNLDAAQTRAYAVIEK